MDYIEYLKKELEKTERRLHYASNKSGVKKEEIKNLKEKANMLSNCIKFICKFSGSEVKPLSWLDLQSRKSKPVYIKEKQPLSNDWFGWWDIIDEVFPNFIRTAYSEEMQRETKGIEWQAYDFYVE